MLQAVSFPQTGSDSTRHFLYQRFRDVKYLLLVNVRSLIPSTRYVKNMDTSSQPIHLPIDRCARHCLAPGADFAPRGCVAPAPGRTHRFPMPGRWLPVGDLCETPSSLTEEGRDGGKNALKASNRERRLRQAIGLIENPAVRQQARARLAATEEQTDRCTLWAHSPAPPASARSAKRTRANKAESKTGSSTARWRRHGWQRLQGNGGLRVLRAERGGHGRSAPAVVTTFTARSARCRAVLH